jgi:uncharacterized protein YkwD
MALSTVWLQRNKGGLAFLAVALMGKLSLAEELGPVPRWLGNLPGRSNAQFGPEVPPINTRNRQAVVDAYLTSYMASENVPMDWNGDILTCLAGTNSPSFREAIIRRVNFFRAMAGLPGVVTLNELWSGKCQEAALMMAAHGSLSHYPDPTWKCYTTAGAEAAAQSNLYHGRNDASAIDGYMDDWGAPNYFVGHRRWILYPPQQFMGTGSVPSEQGILGANALWVVGGFGSRPPQPVWVSWPPEGFLPYQLLPKISARWSLSISGADFTSAQVVMSCAGTNVSLTVEALQNDHGYADNTIVWIPNGVSTTPPGSDLTYQVSVTQVIVAGMAQEFAYSVTVIDPIAAPPVPSVINIVSPGALYWTGVSNSTYTVQGTTNLANADPGWRTIGTSSSHTSVFVFTNRDLTPPHLFYRVVQP